jgi:hypothetical protein
MPRPSAGEVWLVDLGLAAKVRPCLILSDYPADDELAEEKYPHQHGLTKHIHRGETLP